MSRVVFATSQGDPKVYLLNLDSGESIEVPSQLDGPYAFDNALPRRSWVAVQSGYQLAAFRNGDLWHPKMLHEAWQVLPAATEDAALIRPYFGLSGETHEGTAVMVVDVEGRILRTGELPWHPMDARVVGEVDAGIVMRIGIWSWDGNVVRLPRPGTPVAVLAGRVIVLEHDDEVETFDVVDGSSKQCGVPHPAVVGPYAARYVRNVAYNATTTHMQSSDEIPGFLVADVKNGPRWLPGISDGLWVNNTLLIRNHPDLGTVMYDPDTDSFTRTTIVDYDALSLSPRVDVSGRF